MTEEEEYKALLREESRRWKRDQRHPWVKYIRVCLTSGHKALDLAISAMWIEFFERELEKIEPFVGDDGNRDAEDAFMLLSEVYIRLVEARQRRLARINGSFVDKRRPGFFDPW